MVPDVWTTILSKMPELASVVVVAVFALQLTREQRISAEAVMKTWQSFIRAENDRMVAALDAVVQNIRVVDANVSHNTELIRGISPKESKTQTRKSGDN